MPPQTVHQFAEKVALVSDAAGPIGRAVAMQLALQGSYVIGLFPDAGGAEKASVSELVELGTLAHGFALDPSTPAGAREAAAQVNRVFGRLDLLVNCLKSGRESSFESTDEADILSAAGRSLNSVYFLTNAVLDLMKGRPKPKIVNLAFEIERGGDPFFEASQAAVSALTGSFAARLPKNFRVNCVSVKETAHMPAAGELFRPDSAVAPDDAARAVLFLLSPESIGMNGQVVRLG